MIFPLWLEIGGTKVYEGLDIILAEDTVKSTVADVDIVMTITEEDEPFVSGGVITGTIGGDNIITSVD